MVRLVGALVLLWGLLPNPYAYYMLLRLVVCAISAYTAYGYARNNRSRLAWLFGALAVLYNPLAPVYLSRTLWAPIDLATAILFVWSARRDHVRRQISDPE